MNFSEFFIRRPRFSIVISLVMVLLGIMALIALPVAQYPEITPPQIIVEAFYPGASSKVLVDTVAIPIENELNGVEGMLYMESTSDDNGAYQLTITFDIGTDPDIAQVKVENRLQQVMAELPPIVVQEGLDVKTQSANILAMAVLRSPNNSYSDLFLSNYAYINLKNPLSRIKGISDVQVYGPQDSMRVWLNPQKLSSLNLSADDIVQRIENQNIQAAVGSIGSAPSPKSNELVLSLTAKGLLKTVEDFENIVVATDDKGGIILLKDVGRIEVGADSYSINAMYDNAPAVVLGFSQTPNSNALNIMKNLKKEMEHLAETFPADMEFKMAYDSTTFVRASIESIVETLFLTFLLVVLVVYIFLQNPKATLIPTITIPVSLLATFIVVYLLGFNLNILTLFAMILAIGLVVDDAIVVVERSQYLMQNHKLSAQDAAIQAMQQIGGAVIATTFVLLSIFIPVGLMVGITGKIYQQFAVTIAAAVSFSSVNALTLSPALCAIFLNDKKNKKNTKSKIKNIINKFFDYFNRILNRCKEKYLRIVQFLCSRLVIMLSCILITFLLIGFLLYNLPSAFVPSEDQGIILGNVQLSETASINQTKELLQKMGDKIMHQPGIEYFIAVAGASMLGGGGENIALLVVGLTPWDERKSSELSLEKITQSLIREYKDIKDETSVNFYALPSIPGVGSSDGLSYNIIALNQELDFEEFDHILTPFLLKLNSDPNFDYAFTTYRPGTPHLFLDIDRKKLQTYGIPLAALFSTLQNNLGSRYVNDITLAGQINKVIIQADYNYRKSQNDILDLYIPSAYGNSVQVRNFADILTDMEPKIVYRYNQYTSASVISATSVTTSTGEAIDKTNHFVRSDLKTKGLDIAWTGLSLQEIKTSGLVVILIALAIVFGYLFLVALYESWLVALSVMFSNIFAVLGALLGLYFLSLPLSIYAQLGLVLLIGLASKNAILIVEFILNYRRRGMNLIEAALKGASERFRAVLMTALTFILGVFPMVIATGAGASSQRAIGSAVFFGMIFSVSLGIIFIPALYSLFDRIASFVGTPLVKEKENGHKK